jgi:hypothetical protein
MHRATPANSSFRSYVGGGARSTVDQVDDNKLMQEGSGNFMHGESRGGIESPQNYGFTSVCMPADKDEMGNMIASAETFTSFMGGNRSFPANGNMDDRRHRLRGLGSGDVAMNRTNNDDMQIHLASDGMYHSAPQMVRLQLVPAGSGKANPPQSQQQASPAKLSVYAKYAPFIQARLWAGLEPELQRELDLEIATIEGRAASGGSGSDGASTSDPGANLKTGQKAVNGAGANSKDFMHVKQSDGTWSSGKKIRLSKSKEDDDVLHETNSSDGFDYCGGTPAMHKFAIVLTTAGPCKNVKGRIP